MNPADNNSLEQAYEASDYDSSLEVTSGTMNSVPVKARRIGVSTFRYNKTAFRITLLAVAVMALIAGSTLLFGLLHSNKQNNSVDNAQTSNNYAVGSNLELQKVKNSQQLEISQASQLTVNGQLSVTKTLVLSPTSAPTTPVIGQIYYNEAANAPYYYNGSSFVSLIPSATPQHVTSIGGTAGVIGLGNGLSISGGNLSVSSTLLQSVASAEVSAPRVTSLQGLTGAVTLTAGNGIAISGTTITNNGVVGLTSSDGSVLITPAGNGTYNLQVVAGGSGNTSVVLGPNSAQTDSSNNSSINVNKTGSGNFLQFASNGTDAFVVNQSGQITTGTIDYSQVQGAPASTVTTLGGDSGSISIGSGLAISGNSLSNSGVVSINGTANQIIASASSGNLTLSLPQDIGTTSSPTFASETLNSLDLANSNSSNIVSLVGLNPVGSGNATIQFPSIDSGDTDTVCLFNLDNCGAPSNTVTTSSSGTANTLAKFTSAGAIANSGITDDGTNVTIASEGLIANTITATTLQSAGALSITPGGNLTIGATNHTLALQGNATSSLSVSASGDTTTLDFATPTQATIQTVTVPNETGTICLDNESVACGYAPINSGVTLLNGLTGSLSIADATGSGSNITIQDATSSLLGLASFNSNDLTVTSGEVDTIQGISTASTPEFAGLQISTGSLTFNSGGATITGSNSGPSSLLINTNGSANITFETNSGAESFTFPTTGGTGQQICTTAISCASGGGQAVLLDPGASPQTSSANTPAVYINQNGGTGDLLELQSGGNSALTIDNSGNATFANTTTVADLSTNEIVPTSSLSVGSTSQQFTLQGDSSSVINGVDSVSGYTTSLGFSNGTGGTAPDSDVSYYLQNYNGLSGSYDICTTAGNCAGVGGGITGSGTIGDIAAFDNTGNIGNSMLSENATTVTVGGSLAVGTTANSQLSVGVGVSANGSVALGNSTNSNTVTIQSGVTSNSGGSLTLTLPTNAGSTGQCLTTDGSGVLSFANCLSGSGGSGGVASLNSQTGTVAIADATGSGGIITIQNASTAQEGIASFNSTDFSTSSGAVSTIQAINNTATPTFNGLTLQGSQGLTVGSTTNDGQIVFDDGTNDGFTSTLVQSTISGTSKSITIPNLSGTLVVAATGNLTDNSGTVNITNSPSFTTSVSTPLLTSSAGLSITPTGSLTAGSTSQQFTLQGNGSSTLTSTASGITTTVGFTTPTTTRNISFPDASGTVCLTSGNCLGSGGGGANTALSNLSSVAINTSLLPATSTGINLGSGTLPFGQLYIGSGITGTGSPTITGFGTINGATLSGGTLSGGTYTSTTADGLGISSSTVTATGALTISTTGGSNALTLSSASGNISTSGNTINTATISGGTLSGGTVSSGTLTSTAVNSLGLTSSAITAPGALTISTTGGSNALTLSSASGNISTSGGTINGQTISSSANFTGGVTIQGSSGLTLGVSGPTSGTNGQIVFNNSSNGQQVTLVSGVTGSGYTLTLPTSSGSSGQCLTNSGGASNQLAFVSCLTGSGSSGGANAALSNLSSVAINTSLIPGASSGVDLGSNALPFGNIYLGGTSTTPASNNFELTGVATGHEIITLPTATGTLCTISSCTGASAGSGDTSYIANSNAVQSPGNFNITSAGSEVAATIKGAASEDIIDILTSGGSTVAKFDSSGDLVGNTTSDISGFTTVDGATLSGTTVDGTALSGGSVSGSSLSGTQLLFSGASGAVNTASGDNLSIDTGGGTATLNLGASNATTVNLGNSSSATGINGNSVSIQSASSQSINIGSNNAANTVNIGSSTLSSGTQTIGIGNNSASGGTTNITIGSTSAGAGTLTLQSVGGISINNAVNQTISNTSGTQTNDMVIERNGAGGTTTNLLNIDNNAGTATNGLTFTGTIATLINAPTGSTNILSYNSNPLISGAGILQNVALSTSTNYSNLVQVGALNNGSITSGFGTINDGSNIQTTATVQGSTVTATSSLTVGQSSSTGSLDVYNTNGKYVGLTAGTVTTSYTLTLPLSAPSATGNQCLETQSSATQLIFASCGTGVSGGNTDKIIVPAEYAGAVLDSAGDSTCLSSNIGTMTSGYNDTDSSPQTYYDWTSSLSSSECYDVVVQIPVPSNWSAWTGTPTIEASSSSGSVAIKAIGTCSGTTTVDGNYTGFSNDFGSVTTTSSLAADNFPAGLTNSDYCAGGVITLKIRMLSSATNGTANIGTITIPYTSSTTAE